MPSLHTGETLRDERGVQYAVLIPSPLDDDAVSVFHLGNINVVDLFAAMFLTDPARGAIILNRLLVLGTHLANGQSRLIFAATNDMTFPAPFLARSRISSCEHRTCQWYASTETSNTTSSFFNMNFLLVVVDQDVMWHKQ